MSRNNIRKKRKHGKSRKKNTWIIICMLIVLIVLLGVLWKVSGFKKEKDTSEEKEETVKTIDFPYELEDGKIEISSLFQYSGINPDCNDESGEDIAALEIVNKSNEYLSDVKITVTLEDGSAIDFVAKDVPSGQKVWAYAVDNASYDLSVACMDVSCKAQFDDMVPLMEDKITVEVQDTTVTLTNISEEELTNLSVNCHCLFEEAYFGGVTYSYPVEKISAGESIALQVEECYMGEAAVVRISQGGE